MTISTGPRIVLEGLQFPEEPHCRDGLLWFSDTSAGEVYAIHDDGRIAHRVDVHTPCSGFGWLPDGRLVVVDTVHRQLLAANSVSGEVLVHADFSDHVCHRPNGAAISAIGRAYVGSVGFDIDSDSAPEQGAITIVEPDGQVHWGTSVDLWFPNGMAFTIGERSLIVAETLAARLSEYEIAEDGSLGDRRDWAALPKDTYPDGLCIDSEGAVWVADAGGKCVLRVARGGTILDRIDLPRRVYACALGGGTGRTLYLMTAKTHRQAARAARTGSILAVEVSVPAVIF